MDAPWAVIGAGPAGIAAVGMLLDAGIAGKDVIWIDPEFNVGSFGAHWLNVPSNTRVNLFLKFLHSIQSFSYEQRPKDFYLHQHHPEHTTELKHMHEPLLWVTEQLKKQVQCVTGFADQLIREGDAWNVQLKDSQFKIKNIILAIGSEPKKLNYPQTEIPLVDALDPANIKKHLVIGDTVAVFGSSHSAVLAIRNLYENKVKHIINFYHSDFLYAVYYDDWIMYDDSGLKGPTAEWARKYIEGNLIENLTRIQSKNKNIDNELSACNKVIYAIGFERRKHPLILNCEVNDHQNNNGKLAPGLFGVGIAFPEAIYNHENTLEYRVGLWKFVEYLQRVLPQWLKSDL